MEGALGVHASAHRQKHLLLFHGRRLLNPKRRASHIKVNLWCQSPHVIHSVVIKVYLRKPNITSTVAINTLVFAQFWSVLSTDHSLELVSYWSLYDLSIRSFVSPTFNHFHDLFWILRPLADVVIISFFFLWLRLCQIVLGVCTWFDLISAIYCISVKAEYHRNSLIYEWICLWRKGSSFLLDTASKNSNVLNHGLEHLLLFFFVQRAVVKLLGLIETRGWLSKHLGLAHLV